MDRGSCKSYNLDSNAHNRDTQLQVLCTPLKRMAAAFKQSPQQ